MTNGAIDDTTAEPRAPIALRAFAEAGASPSAELRLTFEQRRKSRFRARLADGREVAVQLPRGRVLRDGDRLLGDGELVVRVTSEPEPIVEAVASDPLLHARACYHLGNRHVPVQIDARTVRLAPDHVLEDLLRTLGLELRRRTAVFEPEPGAYGGASTGHSHAHTHPHPHTHDHASGDAAPPDPHHRPRIHRMDALHAGAGDARR